MPDNERVLSTAEANGNTTVIKISNGRKIRQIFNAQGEILAENDLSPPVAGAGGLAMPQIDNRFVFDATRGTLHTPEAVAEGNSTDFATLAMIPMTKQEKKLLRRDVRSSQATAVRGIFVALVAIFIIFVKTVANAVYHVGKQIDPRFIPGGGRLRMIPDENGQLHGIADRLAGSRR